MSALTYIFRIETPRTTKLHYENVYNNMEPVSAEELKKISNERDNLIIALEHSSAESVIKAIERYIPALFGLITATESLPADTTKSLKVSWTTPIGSKYNTSYYTYGSLRYEWTMLLLTLGITYRNAAQELHYSTSESNFEENSKVIADFLKKSASLFDMVKEQWASLYPKPDGSFPELLEQTYVALSTLSLAEAQQFAIKKAAKITSSGTMAKLCADVAMKFEQVELIFRPMFWQIALPAFAAYLTISASLFRALVFKHLGMESDKAGQYGLAVGYMSAAIASFPEEKLKIKNIPSLERFVSEARRERDEIVQLHKRYSADNDTIYFEKVPEVNSLALPEGKSLMKPVPVSFPPPRPITLALKQGYECVIQ